MLWRAQDHQGQRCTCLCTQDCCTLDSSGFAQVSVKEDRQVDNRVWCKSCGTFCDSKSWPHQQSSRMFPSSGRGAGNPQPGKKFSVRKAGCKLHAHAYLTCLICIRLIDASLGRNDHLACALGEAVHYVHIAEQRIADCHLHVPVLCETAHSKSDIKYDA